MAFGDAHHDVATKRESFCSRAISALKPCEVEILFKLVSGGIADIWTARSMRDDSLFLVKYSRDVAIENAYIHGQFEREYQCSEFMDSQKLSNVMAKIYAFGVDDFGHDYLYEEFFDGIGLDRVIGIPCSFDVMRAILVQIVAVMNRFHSHGIVHRDIKPSNILLSRKGLTSLFARDGDEAAIEMCCAQPSPVDQLVNRTEEEFPKRPALRRRRSLDGDALLASERKSADNCLDVRFIDFSLALIGGLPHPSQSSFFAYGTPLYCPPEQALGRPATPMSDWYSLGIILYEWITGRTPFCDEDFERLLHMQVERTPDMPINRHIRGLPREFLTRATSLLEKSPDERSARVGEFLKWLTDPLDSSL